MMGNESDSAIQRALQILAGMSGGISGIAGDTTGGGAIGNAANQAANNAGGGTSVTNASNSQIPPELSQLMNLMMERMRFQEPLFRSVTQQAFMGLPTYAQWRTDGSSPLGSGSSLPNYNQ